MVTAGLFRTLRLARKASPGLDVIQEARADIEIRSDITGGKERPAEPSEAKRYMIGRFLPSLPFTTLASSFMSVQS